MGKEGDWFRLGFLVVFGFSGFMGFMQEKVNRDM